MYRKTFKVEIVSAQYYAERVYWDTENKLFSMAQKLRRVNKNIYTQNQTINTQYSLINRDKKTLL